MNFWINNNTKRAMNVHSEIGYETKWGEEKIYIEGTEQEHGKIGHKISFDLAHIFPQ